MNVSFAGKVILVSGGTGGARTGSEPGVSRRRRKVVVTYRAAEGFAALQNAAGANGSSLDGQQVDVTDEAAVVQLVDRIVAEHGRLDAMVNTIGGYAGGVKLWDLDTKSSTRCWR